MRGITWRSRALAGVCIAWVSNHVKDGILGTHEKTNNIKYIMCVKGKLQIREKWRQKAKKALEPMHTNI